jgi:hypothetical protein
MDTDRPEFGVRDYGESMAAGWMPWFTISAGGAEVSGAITFRVGRMGRLELRTWNQRRTHLNCCAV